MSILRNLNTLSQQILPGHLLSRLTGHIAYCEIPQVKDRLIAAFIKQFEINMDEVADTDLSAYPHFNAFFTRALKPGIRPLAGTGHLASPADGAILTADRLGENTRLQAKGHQFSLSELFATDEYNQSYQDGQFVTIYLSPKDYHRVHCPMDAELKHMTYVPGRLFSVSGATTTAIPTVFARNERVILHFKGDQGPFAMVLVGAMLVASIETPFAGIITPPGHTVHHWNYHRGAHLKFAQGDEVGRFQYGSTVIMVLPKEGYQLHQHLADEQPVRMGESLGQR